MTDAIVPPGRFVRFLEITGGETGKYACRGRKMAKLFQKSPFLKSPDQTGVASGQISITNDLIKAKSSTKSELRLDGDIGTENGKNCQQEGFPYSTPGSMAEMVKMYSALQTR